MSWQLKNANDRISAVGLARIGAANENDGPLPKAGATAETASTMPALKERRLSAARPAGTVSSD